MITLDELLNNSPLIHSNEDGTKTVWRFNDLRVYEYIHNNVHASTNSLETGAGLSTILFAMAGCDHTTICPCRDEPEAILAYLSEKSISATKLNFITDISENALPHLKGPLLDFVLIDGRHGLPQPWIDFYYTARCLKVGGIMLVDDINLYSCHELTDYMRNSADWKLDHEFTSTLAFKKIADRDYMDEWCNQPYMLKRNEEMKGWYEMNQARTAMKLWQQGNKLRAIRILISLFRYLPKA